MSDEPGLAGAERRSGVRRELGEAVRRLASAAVVTRVQEDALEEALALVSAAGSILSKSTGDGRYDGLAGLAPGASTNDDIWETHAAFGRSNPLAPPVVVDVEEPGHLSGTVNFGGAWEGGPKTVYGGFVAAVFDGMLGRAVLSSGHLAVTRRLAVRYLHPTPLGRTMRIESEAGVVDGRDVPVTGRLWDGETLTAEADALFTRVGAERYRL